MAYGQARKIFRWPHECLRLATALVSPELMDDVRLVLPVLRDSLRENGDGVALAANQVGILLRVFAVSPKYASVCMLPEFVLNPSIVSRSPETFTEPEGCLSFPGIRAEVPRNKEIRVEFMDELGTQRSGRLSGFLSRMFQHETDHLDGRLFVDLLPRNKRFEIEALARKRR